MRGALLAAMTALPVATALQLALADGPIPSNVPPPILWEELNWELYGLAPVKAALDAGDEARAREALLVYFGARPDVVPPQPMAGYDTALADGILEGRYLCPPRARADLYLA